MSKIIVDEDGMIVPLGEVEKSREEYIPKSWKELGTLQQTIPKVDGGNLVDTNITTEEVRASIHLPHDPDRWQQVKRKGSGHYKTGGVEPIDLLEAGEILWPYGIGNIIKYAFRSRHFTHIGQIVKLQENLNKIIHYCEILKAMLKKEGV